MLFSGNIFAPFPKTRGAEPVPPLPKAFALIEL